MQKGKEDRLNKRKERKRGSKGSPAIDTGSRQISECGGSGTLPPDFFFTFMRFGKLNDTAV